MTLKQIEDNFSILLRSVDPSIDLLGRLRSVQYVEERMSSIEEQDTDDQKNNALLKALLEVPGDIQESVMNGFISALRSTGQDHVANIFHRENDKVIMSDAHYELLRKKRFHLCKFMNPNDRLIDYLISLNIFSDTDEANILRRERLDDMAKETVNILRRKSDCAFDKFVSALNATNQSHVSYLLTGVGNAPMSDEHRDVLREKIADLEHFVDTENGLSVRLIGSRVITNHDAEQIRSLKDQNAMARKLIEILRRKSDDAFQQFVKLLRETGQSHVAYILTGEGESRPLREEYRKRLLSSPREYLVKMIDSKHIGLITSLMDKGVFSDYDEQRVKSVCPDTHGDRNEMILNLIARKSQQDFFNFMSALNDTNQTHVVVELIGVKIVAKIKTSYASGTDSSHKFNVDPELRQCIIEMIQRNGVVVSRLNEILSHKDLDVLEVSEGCIEITFACKNIQSLHQLQQLDASGELEKMLNEAFCSQFAEKGLTSLQVVIAKDQFKQCEQTFVDCIPMTSEHREALLSSEELLVNKINVNGDLLDKLSLCDRRREAIESAVFHEEQVKTLVDIVSRQPDSAFTQLLNALDKTQQTEVADIIRRGCSSAVKTEVTDLQKTQYLAHAGNELKEIFDTLECMYRDLFKAVNTLDTLREVLIENKLFLRERHGILSDTSHIQQLTGKPGKLFCFTRCVFLCTEA